uniref:adenylate cyclase n=1 Tax=Culicoides sonorensis TaxID=179676 RepID=A0A336MTX6_CULSO
MNIFPLEESFRFEDPESINVESPLRIKLSALLMAVTIALCIFTRHIDRADRVIFMWKTEVSDQKEKAADMRRRNEALIYNVLPVHVAEHFMRNKKRSYDELYSQSYAEVGVLFASMPNFSDFYSEESVNNQGLECLRFLNEVISDFDALLEMPQFHDVIKIKTIGSTYMAASGLNPTKEFKHDDHITLRWAHLENLVDFALELKRALQGINEQSFNHFVLKMGINHGPITAGVIGARKPHYDIWGNTVNVASRMESTGKAGAIQVTQETCNILEKFGYKFVKRGIVNVKGKGELLTYYLESKGPKPPSTPPKVASPVSPTLKTVSDSTTAESPFHLQTTTTSSSTASPNSVRLNQDYDESKLQLTSENTIQELVNKDVSNTKQILGNINLSNTLNNNINNGITNTANSDDVITPLLLPNNSRSDDVEINTSNSTNSNNINSNHVVSEKEALLQDAN